MNNRLFKRILGITDKEQAKGQSLLQLMNTPQQQLQLYQPRELFYRWLTHFEFDCGLQPGWNPILFQSVTIYRQFDPFSGQIVPIVVPITQLHDPFGVIPPIFRQQILNQNSNFINSPPILLQGKKTFNLFI